MTIHPTAVIDPKVELGKEVVIGPYCVVGPEVVLGEGCWLQSQVAIFGPTTIGARNRFHAFCSIGQQTQDLKYSGEPTYLQIGDDNCFREFSTVNRGTAVGAITRVGNHCSFLAYSHIAHDCDVRDHVIFSNNGTLAGHVLVQEHAVLGGLSAVHQFCRVGEHAITGGCSKIVQDVPPFMVADGNPAVVRGINIVGLERRGFSAEVIRTLKEAYRILYRSNLNTKQALEELAHSFADSVEIKKLVEFIEASQRGIIR